MPAKGFQTTRWSMLRRADADAATAKVALEQLCRDYRPPVLAYLRACGHGMDEAEDLTQSFFLRFLDLRLHQRADPERGRFRVFLRTAVRNFVINEQMSAAAQRRRPAGLAHDLDIDLLAGPAYAHPDAVFERAFALTVVDQARRALQQEAETRGRGELFHALADFLVEAPDPHIGYTEVAARLGMRSNSVAVAVHRLRARLQELVEAELLQTLSEPDELEDEKRAIERAMAPAVRAAPD